MNIVQAYTKFNNGCVVLVSGFSGSNKTKYSRFIANLFGFKLADLASFHIPLNEYDNDKNYETLKDGTKILKWDNIYESIDWNKFNAYVNSHKKDGLVVYGFGFPSKLLSFNPDFHILIKINAQNLSENRAKFIESHTSDEGDIIKKIEQDKLISEIVTRPLFKKISEESKFDKVINTNELNEEEIKQELFNYLIAIINKWLENYNKNKPQSAQSTQSVSTFKKPTNIYQTDQSRPKTHYEGEPDAYDEFYYPSKKRVLYDFNDEGIDYPPEFREKYNADKSSSVSDSYDDYDYGESEGKNKRRKSTKSKNDSSSSYSSDEAEFLFTSGE
jgi:hypothetical protein